MANCIKWDSSSIRKWLAEDATCCGNGQHSVYYWADSDGIIFYVGMGKGYRFCNANPKTRSQAFMEMYDKGGCYPKIIAYGMDERTARNLERRVIEELHKRGCELVNKQYVDPSMYHTPARVEFLKRLYAKRKHQPIDGVAEVAV